jgi:hypothetical protein
MVSEHSAQVDAVGDTRDPLPIVPDSPMSVAGSAASAFHHSVTMSPVPRAGADVDLVFLMLGLAASAVPWDEAPMEQASVPSLPQQCWTPASMQMATPVWDATANAAKDSIRLLECHFCDSKHEQSPGNHLRGTEICPCVWYLTNTWGSDFSFIRNAKGIHSLNFRCTPGRPMAPVVRMPGETPLFAWLRREYHMVQKGNQAIVGQLSRQLICCLPRLLGNVGPDQWQRLRTEVSASHKDLSSVTQDEIARMSAILAFHGHSVARVVDRTRPSTTGPDRGRRYGHGKPVSHIVRQ